LKPTASIIGDAPCGGVMTVFFQAANTQDRAGKKPAGCWLVEIEKLKVRAEACASARVLF
jgi:hypothetical protein